MMTVTDAQVRKLMEEYNKDKNLGRSALRSDMDRKTASKYLQAGNLPSQMKKERTWRTRKDPFADDWEQIEQQLLESPQLEAKTLFEDLMLKAPEQYKPGQLRTFQRRVQEWRTQQGPPKDVFFPQQHRPGEALQTDFTCANELRITIAGEPFEHMLCQSVLPYSNWRWVTVCLAESMAAIKRGLQETLSHLGYVPRYHQTDNSTAATHHLKKGLRAFNKKYIDLMRHVGMEPRTISLGQKNQNGDIEAFQRVAKRQLQQHLLLRGSSDFESIDVYEDWIWELLTKSNKSCQERLNEEIAVMRSYVVEKLLDYKIFEVRVTAWSTIRVEHNTYSVPSRLIGEFVKVHLEQERLEIYHRGQHQMSIPRLLGRFHHHINYRHIIWSLVRKPGAFARYRYKDDLFPNVFFRRSYDALVQVFAQREADLHYLRILQMAALTMESKISEALTVLLSQGVLPTSDAVKSLVEPEGPEVPILEALRVELGQYDELLQEVTRG